MQKFLGQVTVQLDEGRLQIGLKGNQGGGEEAEEGDCKCNGVVVKGRGECKTKYKSQNFCYVSRGVCRDGKWSSSSKQYWSYQACAGRAIDSEPETDNPVTRNVKTETGKLCQFPFSYKRKRFTSCTTFDSENGKPWCRNVEGRYEDCADSNPSSAVPRVFQLNDDGTIDCKQMKDCPESFVDDEKRLEVIYTCGDFQDPDVCILTEKPLDIGDAALAFFGRPVRYTRGQGGLTHR